MPDANDGHHPSDEDILATYATDYVVGEVRPVGADQQLFRIVDTVTGGGLFTNNSDPNVVGTDPVTGEDAVSGTDTGFSAPVRRFLQTGLYNGDFSLPPPDPNEPLDDGNVLPYWNWTAPASGSILAYWVEDTTTGSGGFIRFVATNPTNGDEGYLEQLAPVVASEDQQYHYIPLAYASTASGGHANVLRKVAGQYLDVAGATTGASASDTDPSTEPGTSMRVTTVGSGYIQTDANRIRVRIGLSVTADVTGTTTVDFAHASLLVAVPYLYLADTTAPTTYDPGVIYQSAGDLVLQGEDSVLIYAGGSGLDVTVDSSGRVGIGDTSPLAQLEVLSTDDRVTIVGRAASGQTANVLVLEANNGTDLVIVEADGQVGVGATPSDSNAIMTLSSGVNFPDTAVASTDVNTLDDYEEGTWTPALSWVTAGDESWAFSAQTGWYTKVGNLVRCGGRVTSSTSTHTTSSGGLRMTGIPFTATAATQGGGSCVIRGHNATVQNVVPSVTGGTAVALFTYDNGTAALANITAANHTTGNVIDIIFQFSIIT